MNVNESNFDPKFIQSLKPIDVWIKELGDPAKKIKAVLTMKNGNLEVIFEKSDAKVHKKDKALTTEEIAGVITSLVKKANLSEISQLHSIHKKIVGKLIGEEKTGASRIIHRLAEKLMPKHKELKNKLDFNFRSEVLLKYINKKRFESNLFKIAKNGGVPFERIEELAKKLENEAQSDTKTISLNPFIREPLENPEKKNDLPDQDVKSIKVISYEKFRASLRTCFAKTLISIQNSPKHERGYIILADAENKSTNWTASHLMDMMTVHPPKAIVKRENLANFLRENLDVYHIVMVDDGAYSGDQAASYIESNRCQNQGQSFHVNIPYMTKHAKTIIGEALDKAGYIKSYFPTRQMMLSYQDMHHLGYYAQEKINRPDLHKLIGMPALDVNTFPEDKKNDARMINEKFGELRKTIFKKEKNTKTLDANITDRIKTLIDLASKLDASDNKSLNQFIFGLSSVNKGVLRFGTHLAKQETARREISTDSKTTPTLMAHKTPDIKSTGEKGVWFSLKEETIEPYKEIKGISRLRQIKKFQERSPEISSQWSLLTSQMNLKGIEVIQSNRGVFLVADNYAMKPENNDQQVLISLSNQEKIPFGGLNGNFQLKLEDGMTFQIQKGNFKAFFTFENGTFNSTQDGS